MCYYNIDTLEFLNIKNQNLSITFLLANFGESIGLLFLGDVGIEVACSVMCKNFGIFTYTEELSFRESEISTESTTQRSS